MESHETEIVPTQDDEKKEDENSSSPINRLNDPSIYSPQVPFLIYDENKETIISRTAKGINERKLNPFEVDWAEVTLYETDFVRDLLEAIDSNFIMDVAQAIDDEDKRHAREDGQYTNIASDYYGTGQGSANFFSYTRDNWQNDSEYVSAGTIAEGILDKRKKAEFYRQKIKEKTSGQTTELKRHLVEIIDEPDSHLHINMKESIIDKNIVEENKVLKKECDEWKSKHAELEKLLQARDNELDKWQYLFEDENKRAVMVSSLEEDIEKWKKRYKELEEKIEPEKAFNAQTGMKCFTSRQMGILLTAVGRITEKDYPPGKTTLGDVVEKIAGYKSTTASSNMRGAIPNADIETVAKAIESKFPNLAAEVRRV